jgi:predicted nucleic acid-binding protein
MTEAVFLDTGIFIAFLNRHDQWHMQAKALFSLSRPRWSTSYLVVGEAYSWFLHRYGEEAARSFRVFVDKLDGLKIHDVTAEHHRQVGRMLDRLRGAKVSYVDASSLCLLERHKIRKVWSTDFHLSLTGAKVTPPRS